MRNKTLEKKLIYSCKTQAICKTEKIKDKQI